MKLETILLMGLVVNIIGWISIMIERRDCRRLSEHHLNLARLNYQLHLTENRKYLAETTSEEHPNENPN